MDRKKFLAERQWVRNQLAGVADFWLTNGMEIRPTAVLPPAWTGAVRSTPPTRAFGCRAAVAGPMHTCARSTA